MHMPWTVPLGPSSQETTWTTASSNPGSLEGPPRQVKGGRGGWKASWSWERIEGVHSFFTLDLQQPCSRMEIPALKVATDS
jgi:hypothetical protein